MKHDESALVKQAVQDAREQLQRVGRLLPAAYMLVAKNPQTGAKLTYPTALGSVRDEPFASQEEYDEYLAMIREEVVRLDALAVALAGEATAEMETKKGLETRRVFYLRVEDKLGVEQLHALINAEADGSSTLGELMADAGAADMLEVGLMPKPTTTA